MPLKHQNILLEIKNADEYFFRNNYKLSFLKKILKVIK